MKQQKRAEAEQRKAVAKAKRDQEQKVAQLEARIHALEAKVKELTEAMQDPTAHAAGGNGADLSRSLTRTTSEIVALSVEWEREAEVLMAMTPAE
jgi:hypothetical protein